MSLLRTLVIGVVVGGACWYGMSQPHPDSDVVPKRGPGVRCTQHITYSDHMPCRLCLMH